MPSTFIAAVLGAVKVSVVSEPPAFLIVPLLSAKGVVTAMPSLSASPGCTR
ncbi:MAG: hypothetical protein ACKVHO_08965 [Verrucomicrobiia bacterium]